MGDAVKMEVEFTNEKSDRSEFGSSETNLPLGAVAVMVGTREPVVPYVTLVENRSRKSSADCEG